MRSGQHATTDTPLHESKGTDMKHLVQLMMFAACLSESEARNCLRDYRAGHKFSGEAVNHYGGTYAVVFRAVELRTNYPLRKMLRETGYAPK